MAFAVVAALGNPGQAYARTRHNLGWMVADAFAAARRLTWQTEPKFEADLARMSGEAGQPEVWILKPLTFMNLSGKSVQALMRWKRLAPSDVLVIHDELSLSLGHLKVSPGGGAGGHNGVADLIQRIGPDFHRLRLGIGPKTPPQMTQADFVLSGFGAGEQSALSLAVSAGQEALDLLLRLPAAKAMNQLNRPPLSNRPT